MKTVAIITSRWGSKRLPGKALVDIGGKPLLRHIVDSARQAKVDDVIVATSLNSQPIIDYCHENQIHYYAGSEDDVLNRIYQTALVNRADIIVYLWGDCPLIRNEDINKAIDMFTDQSMYLTLTTEYGVIAVMSFETLKQAWGSIESPHDREYFHDYMTNKAIISVDTSEDLERVRKIYADMQ